MTYSFRRLWNPSKKQRRMELRNSLRLESLENRIVFSGASPVAVNDLYEAIAEETLTVEVAGVLANDTDAEGDELAALEFLGPKNGTLELNEDGSFIYQPDPGFSGTDGFVYQADDGTSKSHLAAVTIQVIVPNSPPTGENDAYSMDEDGVLTVMAESGVLVNDSDPDGDELTANLVDGPTNGTLELNPDGSFTYTPDENFNGTDAFTYTAGDGEFSSDLIAVEIVVDAVNDAPQAVGEEYTVSEDETLDVAVPGLLENDSDVDGDPLSVVLESDAENGTLNLNPDGSFSYTPDPDYNGPDSFSYSVTDGELSSEIVTVSITVEPANDAPVGANDAYSIDEDGVLTVMAESGVLVNDSDPDGDELTATLVDGPTNGTLEFNPDGSFTYTPDENFNGTDAFTYTAGDGELSSELIAVEITVNAVNDAPVAMGESYSILEDETLEVVEPGLLGNDSDVDGDSLEVVLDSGPSNGSLEINPDGSFTYQPNDDFSGVDSFTYSVTDGELTSEVVSVEITVEAINDAPQVGNDFYMVDEDNVLEVLAPGVLGNDVDPDGDLLSPELIDLPTNGLLVFNPDGSFEYTPDENFFGTDAFTYRVSDGVNTSDLGVVEINVKAVNDAPIAADDSYETDLNTPLIIEAAGVLANDSDVEGDALTAIVASGPENGVVALAPDGGFVYNPNDGFAGTDTFTYLADDGTATSLATVTIVVDPTGDLPPIAVNDSYQATSGELLEVDAMNGVLANDSDPNGDPLEAILFRGPRYGELTLNADGSFSYTPSAEYVGIDSFIYRVSDGALESSLAVVTLNVSAPAGDSDDSSDDDSEGDFSSAFASLMASFESTFNSIDFSEFSNDEDGDSDAADAFFASLVADQESIGGDDCPK